MVTVSFKEPTETIREGRSGIVALILNSGTLTLAAEVAVTVSTSVYSGATSPGILC